MGFCISQNDSSFFMKKEDQEKAYQLVKKEMASKEYHWQSKGWFKGLRDLFAVLEHWGYEPTLDDETGDMTDIGFTSEKLGDEVELFKVIAPFVKKGSFIEMSGEDGGLWRWVFDGTTCKEVSAKVSWE